ncbi:hypothetical protein PLICRDRAFT_43961 [Plicaturopsis crispa FD-325 SS-3]|nr:hypothetical protein PLICRDRAFT_43961 [Plicaturopsis crispa FD-325 SS-3]
MAAYKSFAVFGAGNVGAYIIQSLAAQPNASTLVVLRAGSTTPRPPLPSNVTSATVDYSSSTALTSVLRAHAIEVVVSAVGQAGLAWQMELARAAQAAGVKLFVPSEYGMPSEGWTAGLIAEKPVVVEYLKEIGLPFVRYYNGLWSEFLPWIAAVKETGKFNIIGKGETPVSFTSLSDVGGFVAHTLTHLPPPRLANATFRIEGERATLLEAAALFRGTYPVAHVTSLPSNIHVHEEITELLKLMEAGMASSAWVASLGREGDERGDSANGLWEGHVWKDLKTSLGLRV